MTGDISVNNTSPDKVTGVT